MALYAELAAQRLELGVRPLCCQPLFTFRRVEKLQRTSSSTLAPGATPSRCRLGWSGAGCHPGGVLVLVLVLA